MSLNFLVFRALAAGTGDLGEERNGNNRVKQLRGVGRGRAADHRQPWRYGAQTMAGAPMRPNKKTSVDPPGILLLGRSCRPKPEDPRTSGQLRRR